MRRQIGVEAAPPVDPLDILTKTFGHGTQRLTDAEVSDVLSQLRRIRRWLAEHVGLRVSAESKNTVVVRVLIHDANAALIVDPRSENLNGLAFGAAT